MTHYLGVQINLKNILVMKSIMRMFELASSLEINFYKTKLGRCGIDHSIMNAFLDVLNCKKMEIPFTYLGVSVGGTIGGHVLEGYDIKS